jgi:hypothetical protein
VTCHCSSLWSFKIMRPSSSPGCVVVYALFMLPQGPAL